MLGTFICQFPARPLLRCHNVFLLTDTRPSFLLNTRSRDLLDSVPFRMEGGTCGGPFDRLRWERAWIKGQDLR